MISIHLIAADRPNFMKVAPLYHALVKTSWAVPRIVHTGQHYDFNMSDSFFQDLGLPEPHIHLGVGSGSHAEQTGGVMIAYEKVLMRERPDLVVVVGDVNSTVAATLSAAKLLIKVAHLEAGLRSFDRTMPEEINRIVTDSLADILWTPSTDADENLHKEGVPENKVERVGNIMIDSLEMILPTIQAKNTFGKMGLEKGNYGVVTLHRPANVDDPAVLKRICRALLSISRKIPLVFPVHPRTQKTLEQSGLIADLKAVPGILLESPLPYATFMNLVVNCGIAITDSGGLQEETTYLGIPCVTVRPNTERPITVTLGTNRLCGTDTLEATVTSALENVIVRDRQIPDKWDGHTAERVVESIHRRLTKG